MEQLVERVFGASYLPIHEGKHDDNEEAASENNTKRSSVLTSIFNNLSRDLNDDGSEDSIDSFTNEAQDGRVGQRRVRFDITAHVGIFMVGVDRLNVTSQESFSTIRANCGVYKGKWMYEVQLGSKGVMQVGWGTLNSKFTQEDGVGDTADSFAYDGNRKRKWNIVPSRYGESWLNGDVIGCCIDLEKGAVEFHRNGRSLGVAFDAIPMGPGYAYFPTVSMSSNETLAANFGAVPFRYPVEGYLPLQDPPLKDVAKGNRLFTWLGRFLNVLVSQPTEREDSYLGEEPTLSAFHAYVGQLLVSHLGPLLSTPYIIEANFLPFIRGLCDLEVSSSSSGLVYGPGDSTSSPEKNKPRASSSKSAVSATKRQKLMVFMDLLWDYMEKHEMKNFLEHTTTSLISTYRRVSFVLEYPHQRTSLLLLVNIVRHRRTRQYLINHVFFDRVRFANFMRVKPLDDAGLEAVVKVPWWESDHPDPKIESNKEAYLSACEKMKEAITTLENMQTELLRILLDNTDATATNSSTRKIFLRKFRVFLHENILSRRVHGLPMLQTPLPLILCFFRRLQSVLEVLWAQEIPKETPFIVPSVVFYDGSINYYNMDRLGGVISHLNKTLRPELRKRLGSGHPLLQDNAPQSLASASSAAAAAAAAASVPFASGTGTGPSASPGELPAELPAELPGERVADTQTGFVFPMLSQLMSQPGQATGLSSLLVDCMAGMADPVYSYIEKSRDKWGACDPHASLVELVDGIILFYHIGAHKQLIKVNSLQDTMLEYIEGLNDTQIRMDKALEMGYKKESSVYQELQSAHNVLSERLTKMSWQMAWVRAAMFSPEKQAQCVSLFRTVLGTVKAASDDGPMLGFLPEFYLDTLVELSQALRSLFVPIAPVENVQGHAELYSSVAQFLCDHAMDPRIVHASSKDTLVQALSWFISRPASLNAMETVPLESRLNLLKALIRPYENRAWGQSNWILVRLWQGSPQAFAFRYQKSPHLLNKLGPKLLQGDNSFFSQNMKPCPSLLLQNHLQELILSEQETSTAFVNSLLNQLNWAFSEFIGMLQEVTVDCMLQCIMDTMEQVLSSDWLERTVIHQASDPFANQMTDLFLGTRVALQHAVTCFNETLIQNVSSRSERVFIESRQLKICATCFDLSVALLRVLEMTAVMALPIFTDVSRPASNLLLSRLCQLLCQILNRVSSQAGCFHHVTTLGIQDLETVDHFPILTAVIGIMLAILADDMAKFQKSRSPSIGSSQGALQQELAVPRVSRELLTEPSFQMSALNFVLGDPEGGAHNQPNAPAFSLLNYTSDVSPEEIETLRLMLRMLEFYFSRLSSGGAPSDDDLCTICYAYAISAKFEPCGHTSCQSCITHHLMNCRECFFCKAVIARVVDLEGNVLHNLERVGPPSSSIL